MLVCKGEVEEKKNFQSIANFSDTGILRSDRGAVSDDLIGLS